MNRIIDDHGTIENEAREGEPPSLEEELALWLRRVTAHNGFGAPEAALEASAQPADSGTNM